MKRDPVVLLSAPELANSSASASSPVCSSSAPVQHSGKARKRVFPLPSVWDPVFLAQKEVKVASVFFVIRFCMQGCLGEALPLSRGNVLSFLNFFFFFSGPWHHSKDFFLFLKLLFIKELLFAAGF